MAKVQLFVLLTIYLCLFPLQVAAVENLPNNGGTHSTQDNITTTVSTLINHSPDPADSWMLPNITSRVFVWILGLTALIGNAFVLIWRCTGRGSENAIQIRLIGNLAVSDFFMGVYLLIIASVDIKFKHGYDAEAGWWKSGVACKLASVLAVFATEASIFIITLISIDRVMAVAVRYPWITKFRLTQTSVTIVSLILWAVALTLGVVPTLVLPPPTVQSDVCLTIPIFSSSVVPANVSTFGHHTTAILNSTSTSSKPQPQSHIFFMMSMFLGLNMFCLLIVAFCYASIFYLVRASTKKLGLTRAKNEIRLCLRMGLIVLTNFLTCMPVVVMGILVQTNTISVTHDVYIFVVIFIISINSACNPYLYTFSAIWFDYRDHRKYKIARTRRDTIPSIV